MTTFRIEGDDISDGYHTFGELYEHRCLLFIRLCLLQPEKCAWKFDIGTPGWVCLYWESPDGQISYHVPDRHRRLFEQFITQDQNYKWDGHTSDEVLGRLAKQ